MKRLIAAGLVSSALLLVSGCGNTGYGTATTQANLTAFNGNPGTPSCSNPVRPPNTALYCPAVNLLPYPFDAYFAGSTDGTLNIQPPNQLMPLQDSVNALDGFSTTAPIREQFNGPIDKASLGTSGAVVVIHINTNNAGPQAKAPVTPKIVGGTGDFTPLAGCVVGNTAACSTADYSVGPALDDPSILEITPLKPLAASTCLPPPPNSPCQAANGGPGEAYLVLLTKAITVGGVAAAPDVDYANFQAALASGGPTCPSITVATLNALCQLTGAHLELAQLYAHIAPGFNPANVVASFSFSTLSTTDTLAAAASLATPQSIKVNPTGLTTHAFHAASPGFADVYVGVMTLPYYLATTAMGVTAPDTYFWQASAASAPDKTSTFTTRFNPLPVATVKALQVPVLMTVPNISSKPATGWPIVIFEHGVTADRTNLLAIADALAEAGFLGICIDMPLHGLTQPYNAANPATYLYASSANPWYKPLGLPPTGSIERTFDLDTINMAAGVPGLDSSGSHYLNLKSVLTLRDNMRESSVDLVTLAESLGSITLPSPATAPYVDPTKVHYIGHSQGAIIGAGFLAVMPPAAILTATLANPGGKFAYLGIDSATFGPPTIAGLEKASNGLLTPGTTPFAQYIRDSQSVLDAGDPLNFIGLAVLQHPIHMIEVVGTNPPPPVCTAAAPAPGCPDQVVPNSATDLLITAGGFTQVHPPGAGPSATPLPPSVVKFTAGTHKSFLDPTAGSAAATLEMQTEAATFAATDGTYLPVSPTAPVQ